MCMLNRDGPTATFLSHGAVIQLGQRRLTLCNLPGYTTESVVLFDTEHNQVFTGNFVCRHLGGTLSSR